MWFFAWLTLRRAQRAWRLMLATAFGVLLATTLMSAAVSHSTSLATAGLRYTLNPEIASAAHDLQVTVFNRPMGRADYDRLDQLVTEKIDTHVGWLVTGMHRDSQAQGLTFSRSLDPVIPEGGAALHFFYQAGFKGHTRLVEGRWPESSVATPEGERRPLEVVIGSEALETLSRIQWAVGMDMYVIPSNSATAELLPATIVGVAEAIDPEDPYWGSTVQRLRTVNLDVGALIFAYMEEADFFNGVGAKYPTLLGTYSWYADLEPSTLTTDSARVARQALTDLEGDLNQTFPRTSALSGLGNTITEYERRLALARVPLFMFISLVVGVVLYYLVLISWMLARSRGNETALLRSRGASALQMASLLGLGEGLLMVAPAVAIGPFLGASIARLLPIGGDAQVAGLAGALTPDVFAVAAVVGVVSIVVILMTGLLASGQNMVEFLRERSRPVRTAALYRYAIDLAVLAAVGLMWWQIRGRGGLLTQRLLGEGLDADLSLLLGPALLLLAIGLTMLRVLPYLLRLVARLAASLNAVWLVHGFNRMARDPFPYGALAVLLMLATSLGLFGATFGPTLTGSLTDQVRYAIGGAIVVPAVELSPNQTPEEARRQLAGLEGVLAVSPVHKGILNADEAAIGGGQAGLLAVDPDDLVTAGWFRPDFADQTPKELLAYLPQDLDPDAGIPLPEGTEQIGVWARAERPYPGYSLWARFRDSELEFEHFVLGGLGSTEWTYMQAPIPLRLQLRPPYHLMGFYVTGPTLAFFGKGSVAIDNAVAVLGGEQYTLETFEELGSWEPIPSLQPSQDEFTIEGGGVSGRAGRFGWTYPIAGGTPRGIFNSPVTLPIPAIGSPPLVPGQNVMGLLSAQAIPLQVKAVANFFPAADPVFASFLVVDLEALDLYQRYLPRPRPVFPSEFWIALKPGADKAKVLEQLADLFPENPNIRDREAEAEKVLDDPLSGGAWYGLAIMAMGTLSMVALVGMALYTALAFRRTRLELGLLRAIGLTRRQLGLTLGLEGVVVAIVGLAVGAGAGMWMGRWGLSYLGVTVAGQEVVPPLIVALDDGLMALVYVGVGLAALFATVLAVTLAARLRLAEVLRVEE